MPLTDTDPWQPTVGAFHGDSSRVRSGPWNSDSAFRKAERVIGKRVDQRDDAALVEACLADERQAWDELIERYGRLVYSIPMRYGFGDADADDVFQSVFVILYRKLDTLRDQQRLSSWLITTTHRECWRIGRKRNRELDLDHDFADVSTPSEHHSSTWERQHLVREGLKRLGGQCAELLTALFLEPNEQNYEQIAERLGMKVGSIGPTRARCFRKLERILVEMGIDDRTTSE